MSISKIPSLLNLSYNHALSATPRKRVARSADREPLVREPRTLGGPCAEATLTGSSSPEWGVIGPPGLLRLTELLGSNKTVSLSP